MFGNLILVAMDGDISPYNREREKKNNNTSTMKKGRQSDSNLEL